MKRRNPLPDEALTISYLALPTGLNSHSTRRPCPHRTSKTTLWDPGAPLWTIPSNSEYHHLWRVASEKGPVERASAKILFPYTLTKQFSSSAHLHISLQITNRQWTIHSLNPHGENEVTKTFRIHAASQLD